MSKGVHILFYREHDIHWLPHINVFKKKDESSACFQVSQSKLVPTSHLLGDCKQWVGLGPFTSLSKQSAHFYRSVRETFPKEIVLF